MASQSTMRDTFSHSSLDNASRCHMVMDCLCCSMRRLVNWARSLVRLVVGVGIGRIARMSAGVKFVLVGQG